MKLTREEAMKIAGETAVDVAQMYAPLLVEDYRQWCRKPKMGKKPYMPTMDRAGMSATYIDLFETKIDAFKGLEVEGD